MPEFWIWLPVLIVVLFAHELGHLVAARIVGFAVESVSVGFGPRLLDITDRQGTRWSLCLFPLGASCSVPEAARTSASSDQSCLNHFSRRQLYKEALVYSGGPIFSIALTVIAVGIAAPLSFEKLDFFSFDVMRSEIERVSLLIAAVSLCIGVFNLIPLPPLDGGRLLFIGVDLVRGKKIAMRTEQSACLYGFRLLMAISLGLVLYAFAQA